MKTKRFFKNLLLVPCLILVMSSCNKTETPKFEMGLNEFYIVQIDNADGSIFYPRITFFTVGEDAMKEGSGAIKFGSQTLQGRSNLANTYESVNGINSQSDIKQLNGTYYLEATSINEKFLSHSLELSFTDNHTLGEMTVSDFTIENGMISAKIEAKKATLYFFLAHPITTSGTRLYDKRGAATQPPANGIEGRITMSTVSLSSEYDQYEVYPVAAGFEGHVWKLGTPKTFRKNGTSWEEVIPE